MFDAFHFLLIRVPLRIAQPHEEHRIGEAVEADRQIVGIEIGEESFLQYRNGFLTEEVWQSRSSYVLMHLQNEIGVRNFEFLKEHVGNVDGCEVLAADGGWYAIVKIPNALSEEQWVLTFLNKDHVAVHPGYFFDFPTEAFIIVSLIPLTDTFGNGVKRIIERIKNKVF